MKGKVNVSVNLHQLDINQFIKKKAKNKWDKKHIQLDFAWVLIVNEHHHGIIMKKAFLLINKNLFYLKGSLIHEELIIALKWKNLLKN